jgi:hypothetical protein
MRIPIVLALLTLLSLPALAQDSGMNSYGGYLIYRDCAQIINDKLDQDKTLANYDSKRALQCKSGYGLITNGLFYVLDKRGNQLAKSLIASWNSSRPLMVIIHGKMTGKKIDVHDMSNTSVQTF